MCLLVLFPFVDHTIDSLKRYGDSARRAQKGYERMDQKDEVDLERLREAQKHRVGLMEEIVKAVAPVYKGVDY